MEIELRISSVKAFQPEALTTMEPVFDIFSRLPDGSPLWLESVEGFEQAQRRLSGFARTQPGEYFIYSEKSGGVICRVSEPGFEGRDDDQDEDQDTERRASAPVLSRRRTS
jgi:hypothetical protein